MARATKLHPGDPSRPAGSSGDADVGGAPWTHADVGLRDPVGLPPLLSQSALEVAERWALRVRMEALQEQRVTMGGWPGTLSEARAVVVGQLLPGLSAEGRREVGLVDREQMARFVYRSARSWWRRMEGRDDEVAG